MRERDGRRVDGGKWKERKESRIQEGGRGEGKDRRFGQGHRRMTEGDMEAKRLKEVERKKIEGGSV